MARPPVDTPRDIFEQYQLPVPVDSSLNIVPTPSGSIVQTGDFSSPNFVSGRSGWKLDANGNFEAVNGKFRGAITAASLDIPDTTTANSFHVDSNGNAWWGATTLAGSTAKVLNTGVASFSNMTITGGAVSTGVLNKGLMAWSTNIAFTSASATQVNWSSGTIKVQDGTTYAISSGNTGAMAALTYIYLDIAVSLTVLQTTTTYSTATGDGKIMVAIAQNNTVGASVIPYGGGEPVIDGAQINALSIVAGNIAASTITAGKLSVSQLSAIAADLGSITAGSINISSGVASISSAGAAIFKSIQVGGSSVQYSLNDSGIFSFGDGSDGDVTISVNTTLTRDMYYKNLTVNSAAVLNPGQFRIFCSVSLTLSGNATINQSGNAGGDFGSNGNSPLGGASIAAGYFLASAKGGSWAGTATGANATNALGGNGGTGGGSTGSAGGTSTVSNVKLIANWHLATLLDITSTGSTAKFQGGAGGGCATGATEGGNLSGAGGGSAGIIAIYAKTITINSGSSIITNGGKGGNATGGGHCGGGGAGGIIILTYNALTNSGSLTANGGAAGTGGAGGGVAGDTGAIYQFQISL